MWKSDDSHKLESGDSKRDSFGLADCLDFLWKRPSRVCCSVTLQRLACAKCSHSLRCERNSHRWAILEATDEYKAWIATMAEKAPGGIHRLAGGRRTPILQKPVPLEFIDPAAVM